MRLIVAVMGAFLTLSSAFAQQAGFRPDTATSTATLSVTTSSSSTSAGTALLALVCNIGTVEAFVAIGPSNVAATTSGASWPGGFCNYLQLNPGNYLAAITASSTTTLRVTYGSGTPPIAGAGSGGGGSGGLSVTDQTAWTQGSSAFTPNGGVFNDTATLSSGQEGTQRLTTKRAGIVDVDTTGNALYTAITGPVPAGTNTIGTVGQLPYPVGAIPYTASATGTTAATTATLTGAASVTTYLCGFSIRANATAAATGNATVTGTITATLNFTQWTAPLASGLGITEMIFSPCIPASATNTSIAVVSAAPGSGGVVSVTSWGYKL